MTNALRALLSPSSIAILGASNDYQKINGRPLKALLDKGYAGAIYPVNPKYQAIAHLRCYPSVDSIDATVDLAIVAVPAKRVAESIRALGRKGVAAAVVFSSGFGEMGAAGAALDADLKQAIRDSGVRVLGPNCLGLINAFDGVAATFTQYSLGPTLPGPVAFVTQSGALGTATAGLARKRGLNFGYFVNTGNEADIRFVDAMREILHDPRIRAGAGYIEGLKDGPGLYALGATALDAAKPLVITKVGRTLAGARAIASHTGSLAGEDAVFDGVLRQVGIVRARSDEHLLDLLEALVNCPVPRGRGVGIVTRSGGAGALLADRCEELGLDVARLSDETRAKLRRVVPEFGSLANPVDITAQGLVDPSIMRESIKIVLADPAVDAAIVWLAFTEKYADMTVDIFDAVKRSTDKPFVVAWPGIADAAQEKMRAKGIALLRGAEPAAEALAALIRYGESRRRWQQDAAARAAIELPALALPAGEGVIDTLAAARLLAAAGVSLVPAQAARTPEEALACARALGYPVALKIESPDIAHKTDIGGVRLDLADEDALRAAFTEITASARAALPQARLDGVTVQPMARAALELVIGLQNDAVFGPVVMVGLGGVLVEVLKDVVFRRCPVSEDEAARMLNELRGRALLDAVRGRPAVDRSAVARQIAAVSRFGAAAGKRLRELDLNPVFASAQGCVAVDWLLALNE
ncbi:MAG: acetate--CoA ligase family protein [Burkholderiales bacterium]|nr:acetate--CoA ligase family protein [Burkholderiales bacterium]